MQCKPLIKGKIHRKVTTKSAWMFLWIVAESFFFFEVYIIIYYMDLLQEDSLKQPSWTMNLNSIHSYVTSAFQKKKKNPGTCCSRYSGCQDIFIFSNYTYEFWCDGAELCLEDHYFRPWDSLLNRKIIMHYEKHWFEIMSS